MKKVFIVLIILLSCKPTEKVYEIKSETIIEKESESTAKNNAKPIIELSTGPNIEIQDVELRDFRKFMVWVTTIKKDTIANCQLEKVPLIKGIEKLPHFFVKFQTLPIVYKMKIENGELVFAEIDKMGTD
jgi:hypothetical protein